METLGTAARQNISLSKKRLVPVPVVLTQTSHQHIPKCSSFQDEEADFYGISFHGGVRELCCEKEKPRFFKGSTLPTIAEVERPQKLILDTLMQSLDDFQSNDAKFDCVAYTVHFVWQI